MPTAMEAAALPIRHFVPRTTLFGVPVMMTGGTIMVTMRRRTMRMYPCTHPNPARKAPSTGITAHGNATQANPITAQALNMPMEVALDVVVQAVVATLSSRRTALTMILVSVSVMTWHHFGATTNSVLPSMMPYLLQTACRIRNHIEGRWCPPPWHDTGHSKINC